MSKNDSVKMTPEDLKMLLELADCGCIRYQPTSIGTTVQGFAGGVVTREPYTSEDCERVVSAIAEAIEELVNNQPPKPHETGVMYVARNETKSKIDGNGAVFEFEGRMRL